MTHPHPKRYFVPRAFLMKSGLKTLNTARQSSSRAAVSVNTARPINTAYTRLERISKKRTKNEAKTTKPDTEWKSMEKTQSSPSPSVEKSTQVNPDKPEAKSQEKQV
ncbi:hypothetical protein Tco_1541499 [Tanacetum coccineum]